VRFHAEGQLALDALSVTVQDGGFERNHWLDRQNASELLSASHFILGSAFTFDVGGNDSEQNADVLYSKMQCRYEARDTLENSVAFSRWDEISAQKTNKTARFGLFP